MRENHCQIRVLLRTTLVCLTLLFVCGRGSGQNVPTGRTTLSISYDHSPYADYLYFLLYRAVGPFPQLSTKVSLTGIPAFKGDTFLPVEVAQGGINSYSDLYKKAESYDERDRLLPILHAGETRFPEFFRYWKNTIEPVELATIAQWKTQDAIWSVVENMEKLERLPIPFTTLNVHVVALNPAGSSMPRPFSIYTTTVVPSLAWVFGHEATHQVLHRLGGVADADYLQLPGGGEALTRVKASGGVDYDIEEAACLLMQAKLSIAGGYTRPDFRTSRTLKASDSPRAKVLVALENDWPQYLANPKLNLAQFLVAETNKALAVPVNEQ